MRAHDLLSLLRRHPLRAAGRPVRRVGAWLHRRRLLGSLEDLDDRMLRDIGLRRNDLWLARAEPLFRDPTLTLAGRAEEARLAVGLEGQRRRALDELRRAWLEDGRIA